MTFPIVRSLLVLASAATAGAAIQPPKPNPLVVVVGNGPRAGTYQAPGADVICMHARKQKIFTAAWRDFAAHDPKAMSEAGINISNPDDAGAKRGDVRITFGDPEKKPLVYLVTQVPLGMVVKGKAVELSFTGKTADGVALRVTATCTDVQQI